MITSFLMDYKISIVLLLILPYMANGAAYLSGPFSPRNAIGLVARNSKFAASGNGPCGEGVGSGWTTKSSGSDLNGEYTTEIHHLARGEPIEFVVNFDRGAGGHFVFELCRPSGSKITHDCFTTRLQRDPSDSRMSPYVSAAPHITPILESTCAAKEVKVRYIVPQDFAECGHCVLRWYWQTGDTCASHPALKNLGADLSKWSLDGCHVARPPTSGDCGTECPNTHCLGTRYANCVDVKIAGSIQFSDSEGETTCDEEEETTCDEEEETTCDEEEETTCDEEEETTCDEEEETTCDEEEETTCEEEETTCEEEEETTCEEEEEVTTKEGEKTKPLVVGTAQKLSSGIALILTALLMGLA